MLTITISDEATPLVIDAYCKQYGYEEMLTGDKGELFPNPQTREEFTIETIKNSDIARVVTSYQQSIQSPPTF